MPLNTTKARRSRRLKGVLSSKSGLTGCDSEDKVEIRRQKWEIHFLTTSALARHGSSDGRILLLP
jgi:hypothetical protein